MRQPTRAVVRVLAGIALAWLWLAWPAGSWAETGGGVTPVAGLEHTIARLTAEDPAEQEAATAELVESSDPNLLSQLEALREEADRSTRRALKPVLDLLKNRAKLGDDDPEVRRAAATDLGSVGSPLAVPWLESQLVSESHRWVRYALRESLALIRLAHGTTQQQVEAVRTLGDLASPNGLPRLKELVEEANADESETTGAGSGQPSPDVLATAHQAIEQTERWGVWAGVFETLFHGLSLSSILLMMALGLAIVFGLMGVINMAHGELMMIGAYATFVTQELFKAYLPTEVFDWYFWAALPCSFLAAALVGLLLEMSVIRFLYGRPLETMLATWGVSLILIQSARVMFGDLTAVTAPAWFSGGVQVMVGVFVPYNRLFLIVLSAVSVMAIYALLFRTRVGLRVRAVMQNRNMSACLGIPTRQVDAYTFAFGSGLAGLAGWGLTLIGNVEPGLGQNYIVDSFMVVVTGGVGKLAGTIAAALGIGGLNKVFEPSMGAVYAKVTILLLVVLFLQRRPSGLFAIKGRHAES
ncbi:branched-chain amino acid ABC transporter permease [Nitrospira sp.]|nr:branched-chain amino acid ABC transporter permease [Nitrospira sp.]